VGSALGLVDRRVQGDLERFKDFIEARGVETGAWRGEIHGRGVESEQGRVGHAGVTSSGPTRPSPTSDLGGGTEATSTGLGGRETGAYGETATGSRASSDFSREGEAARRTAGFSGGDVSGPPHPGYTEGATGGVTGTDIEGMGRRYPGQPRTEGPEGRTTSGYDEREMTRISGTDYEEEIQEERRHDQQEGLDRAA
jgi:hypothetical protein